MNVEWVRLAVECGASAPPLTGRLDGLLLGLTRGIACVDANSRGCSPESGAESPQSKERSGGLYCIATPLTGRLDGLLLDSLSQTMQKISRETHE